LSLSRAETKNLRALQTKKGRRQSGRFIAEGVRLLEEALRFRVSPAHVYWAPSLLSERGTQLLDNLRKSGAMVTQISAAELGRIADTETSQGIVAVFVTPTVKSGELALSSHRNVLLCENISDPGNLGTLIRSAVAFAFDPVVLAGECAEPFSPKVVRASVGAIFGTTVAEVTADQIVTCAQHDGFALIAAGTQGSEHMEHALSNLPGGPVMLAIGSEADGLSETITGAADRLVRINHTDQVESLNAAIAGSILMKQCYDQRTQRKP
jgi:TrmH family RNA methyltransferase